MAQKNSQDLIVVYGTLYIKIGSTIICLYFITPHAQRERGKVIGRGVHIYIYIYIYIYMSVDEKNI